MIGLISLAVCIFYPTIVHAAESFCCPLGSPLQSIKTQSTGPEWGSPAEPLVLKDSDQFDQFKLKVTESYMKVIETNVFDSLSNYLRVYKTYGNSTEPFDKFFASYVPIHHPKEDTYGLTLALLEKLKDQLIGTHPTIENHMYIVSVQMGVPALEFMKRLTNNRLVKNRPIVHIMACIKILFKNRPGFMVLDVGLFGPKPFVVMEDSAYPHSAATITLKNPKLDLSFSLHKNFVLSRKDTSETSLDPGDIVEYVINVGRPFCSFLSTTVKPNLLHNLRSLVKRNADGSVEAGVYFQALPRGNTSEGRGYPRDSTRARVLKLFTTTEQITSIHEIPFELIKKEEEIKDTIKSEIEKANTQLGFEEGKLLKLLLGSAEVMNDQNFLSTALKTYQFVSCEAVRNKTDDQASCTTGDIGVGIARIANGFLKNVRRHFTYMSV